MLLSIIIPTYNERENIVALLNRLVKVLESTPTVKEVELIVVDDSSPDGTADVVLQWLADRCVKVGTGNPELARTVPRKSIKQHLWVRLAKRSRKMGLASAITEGMRKAKGDIIGFMDGDLSHPPEAIPSMLLEFMESQAADLVIGSRYVSSSSKSTAPWHRRVSSRLANRLARTISPVKDSTSGFLFFRRHVIDPDEIETEGFQIGLDIITKGKHRKYKEIGYQFSGRKSGESKLDAVIVFQFGVQLGRLLLRKAKAYFCDVRSTLGRPHWSDWRRRFSTVRDTVQRGLLGPFSPR